MLLFRKLTFYLALAGIVASVVLVQKLRTKPPPPPPFVEPARSPYAESVAATGILEATRENVKVATTRPGLVTRLFVEVGSRVQKGDPLFQLDDREVRARIATAEAQVGVLEAALRAEQVQAADAADQFARVERLEKEQVASVDERKRKEFQLQSWNARVARIDADLQAARAQLAQARVELDLLTVRAPRDGTLLQVSIREGEHAALAPVEPLMILGDTDTLQVRADVDEQNAPRVSPHQPAVAFLKGETTNSFPLVFVRIEPYVVPKRSLTGDSTERVDTRVLQIIYRLEKPRPGIYVGQQVDVFIQAGDQPSTTAAAGASNSSTTIP
jgi:RND family efflux transporter MFP subunit